MRSATLEEDGSGGPVIKWDGWVEKERSKRSCLVLDVELRHSFSLRFTALGVQPCT